jgi:hypothetical protein
MTTMKVSQPGFGGDSGVYQSFSFLCWHFKPGSFKFPFDRPCPDTDIVKMAAGLADDDPLQFLAMPANLP